MEIFSGYVKSEDGNNLHKTTCPLTRNIVLFKWLERQAEPIWPCTKRICFHCWTKKLSCLLFLDTELLLPLCSPGPLLSHELRFAELHVMCCWEFLHPSPSALWGHTGVRGWVSEEEYRAILTLHGESTHWWCRNMALFTQSPHDFEAWFDQKC